MGDQVRKKKFDVKWYKDCVTVTEKDDREKQILSASTALVLLKEILRDEKDKLATPKLTDYEVPHWQYKLAHVNGQIEQIDRLLKLLDPIEE
jgi:hypothetical protein